MNQSQFEADLTPLVRHAVTGGAGIIAGLLAAHGYATQSQEVLSYAVAGAGMAAAYAVSVGWSLVSSNKTATAIVTDAPFDEVGELASVVQDFRARGASPMLVAHTAQVLASLAVAETQTPPVIASPPVPATQAAEPPLAAGDPPIVVPPAGEPASGAFISQVSA